MDKNFCRCSLLKIKLIRRKNTSQVSEFSGLGEFHCIIDDFYFVHMYDLCTSEKIYQYTISYRFVILVNFIRKSKARNKKKRCIALP